MLPHPSIRVPPLATIYAERFDEEVAASIKRSRLRLDHSIVARAPALTESLLRGLFDKRYCAIHIRGYFSGAAATRAARYILSNSKVTSWYIPDRRSGVRTDMSYGIGIPRQVAERSEAAARKYLSGSLAAMRKVRKAFCPQLSPMDRLRLELDEIWPGGVRIAPFRGKNGYVGLARIMRPETLFAGVAGRKGVCHVDAGIETALYSANLYVRVPPDGGELRIWNVRLDRNTQRNDVYSLIARHRTFDAEMQEVIHSRLPPPLVVRPRDGDLVILDSSRPHAVGGFRNGIRVSIQSFLTLDGDRLSLHS